MRREDHVTLREHGDSENTFELEDLPQTPWLGLKPRVGDRVGGYRLVDCLKEGDRGLVFRGVHDITRRRVVIKYPARESVWNGIAAASLEAMLLAQLRIPGVVKVIDAGRDRSHLYLVLESITGETLDERLTREKRIPPRTASRLLRESARAMAAIHALDVLHGDLKPGNLMIPDSGPVRIIDFGLARFAGLTGGPFGEEIVAASPLYMSPEQATNQLLSPASDIYSLGATFYHVLGGTPPFTGGSPSSLARRHQAEPPVPLRTACPDLPPGLTRIVEHMLAKRPEDRHATMADVASAVEAWEKGDDRHAA